jgi:hypothetical protein
MPTPPVVRPGATVPRSGIYQDTLSQRRATLVKGEPAPPTPYKAGCWQQVIDTAAPPRPLPWPLWQGIALGAGLTWGMQAALTRDGAPRPRWAAARWRGWGVVWAFCAGVVCGHALARAASLGPGSQNETPLSG